MLRTLTANGTGQHQRDGVGALLLIAEALENTNATLQAMLAIMKDVHEKGAQ